MNLFADASFFLIAWTLAYLVSEDIMKFLAKQLVFLTAIVALYEGYALYGPPIDALLALTIVIWVITLILDYMNKGITKPAQAAVGNGGRLK